MSKPIKFTDVAVYQGYTLHDMKVLKSYGSQFNFVKLTEDPSPSYPYKYVNPRASYQISNSYAVWGDVGVYHFWHTSYGNSASFFIDKVKKSHLDIPTTKVALDVEAPDLPYYCTNAINEFESQLVKAGFKPGNIWTYVSKNWINLGRVVPSKLKYGFVWCAYYPYNNIAMDNAIKPNSGILPRFNAVQFSGLGNQDWSYDYTGTLVKQPAKPKPKKHIIHKPKIKHVVKKPANNYLKSGKTFEVIANGLSGYTDPSFKKENGVYLTKGSRIHGQVVQSFKTVTRLDTPIGWFTTNTKYVKAVK